MTPRLTHAIAAVFFLASSGDPAQSALLPAPTGDAPTAPKELTVGDFPMSVFDTASLRDAARAPLADPPVAPRAADGKYEIDVLVLYTRLYAARYGSPGARSEASRLIALANSYNDKSGVPVRYRLVGARAYRGTSENSDFFENRDALVADQALRELRDQLGADLVTLLRTMDGDRSLCGLASGFNGGERGGDPPQNVDPERDAFSVSGMGPSASGFRCADYVFAHELGHDLSAGHSFVAAPFFVYWKSYARGAVCLNPNTGMGYTSIMAALPKFYVDGTLYPAVAPSFTNPDLLDDGTFCGYEAVEGSDVAEANNARAMAEAAPYVAAYRPTRVKATARGAPAGSGGAFTTGLALLVLVGLRFIVRGR